MVSFTYRGTCAAVFQGFNKDLSVNTKIIPDYANYLAKNGVDGVLVHGTSGEGMSLTVSERKCVVEAWAEAVKKTKLHLMVQVGGCPLPDVLDLAKHAENIGAGSILCLPELYFKPTTPKELINYLKHVGEAAPKTPLLYYHNPGKTGLNINMANFLDQYAHEVPNLKGIKYTSNDIEGGLAAVRAKNREYAVFLGFYSVVAPAFSMDFNATIASSLNMFPQYTTSIAKAIKDNNVVEAKRIQEELITVIEAVTKDGPWIPSMKLAMSLLTPINVGKVRPPLVNLTEEQASKIKESLERLKLI